MIGSLEFQRLLRAFTHWVHRDHDHMPECAGCVEAAVFLTIRGYEGDTEHPLTN